MSLVNAIQVLPRHVAVKEVKIESGESVSDSPYILEPDLNLQKIGIHMYEGMLQPNGDGIAKVTVTNVSGISLKISEGLLPLWSRSLGSTQCCGS